MDQSILNQKNIILLILSSIFSWLILRFSISKLEHFLNIKPDSRSSHYKDKPSGGGISFCIVGTLGCMFCGNFLPLFCIPLALVGLFDDKFNLPQRFRIVFQISTSIFLLNKFFLKNFELDKIHSSNAILAIIVIIFCSVALINFVNFMDGIDGIIGGSLIIIFIYNSFINESNFMPLIGALLGFIIWNWAPAKVFMGDMGSTFLGAIFVGILMQSNFKNLISLLLVSSPLWLDASICLLRRLNNKEKIFTAHRSHLYQRLCQSGWSHSIVTINYMTAIIFIAISRLIGGIWLQIIISFFIFSYGVWLDINKAVPFKKNKFLI